MEGLLVVEPQTAITAGILIVSTPTAALWMSQVYSPRTCGSYLPPWFCSQSSASWTVSN